MKKLLIALYILIGIFACHPKLEKQPEMPELLEQKISIFPKNIILLIGNGMGLAHITAGLYRNDESLNIEKFPVTGVHQPYNGNQLVPDSLSTAIALALGRNFNAALLDSIGINSILVDAKNKGKSIGMITNANIESAIPSAFIAYQDSGKPKNIIAQFFDKKFDLFAGKTFRQFDKYSTFETYDFSNLITNKQEDVIKNIKKNQIILSDSKDSFLRESTEIATNFLKQHSENGFFLLIEDSNIRDAAYANKGDALVEKVIEFDKTIGAALAFAEKDKETLVILTSNQEAGGFAINPGSSRDTILSGFTTTQNTGIFLPVFAFGPGSELFHGLYENTAIHHKMKQAFQLK